MLFEQIISPGIFLKEAMAINTTVKINYIRLESFITFTEKKGRFVIKWRIISVLLCQERKKKIIKIGYS